MGRAINATIITIDFFISILLVVKLIKMRVQPGKIVDQLIYLVNFICLRNILTSISALFTTYEIHCVLKSRFVEKSSIPHNYFLLVSHRLIGR